MVDLPSRDNPAVSLDHVALEAGDFDGIEGLLVGSVGMSVTRAGQHSSSGNRIAMLRGQGDGMLELIHTPETPVRLAHIAYRVDDVRLACARLVERGLHELRGPHRLDSARADTALLVHPGSGLRIQLIKYDDDSPDLPGNTPEAALPSDDEARP